VLPVYRQDFLCSAVLTLQHYHWYAATRFEGNIQQATNWIVQSALRQSVCWRLMHYDVKISGARIRTHELWIRKRMCYPRHHSVSQLQIFITVSLSMSVICLMSVGLCRKILAVVYSGATYRLSPVYHFSAIEWIEKSQTIAARNCGNWQTMIAICGHRWPVLLLTTTTYLLGPVSNRVKAPCYTLTACKSGFLTYWYWIWMVLHCVGLYRICGHRWPVLLTTTTCLISISSCSGGSMAKYFLSLAIG